MEIKRLFLVGYTGRSGISNTSIGTNHDFLRYLVHIITWN